VSGLELTTALAILALGVSAGALVAEGAVLVPFWRGQRPEAFLAWYRKHAALLFRFFGSLEVVTMLLTVAALVVQWRAAGAAPRLLVAAVLLLVGVLGVFPLYFQQVNTSFERGTITLDRVPDELARWARWHWFRTALALGAFAAALVHAQRAAGRGA
jgi:hypothetical protein